LVSHLSAFSIASGVREAQSCKRIEDELRYRWAIKVYTGDLRDRLGIPQSYNVICKKIIFVLHLHSFLRPNEVEVSISSFAICSGNWA
jgi:hypothetical protein